MKSKTPEQKSWQDVGENRNKILTVEFSKKESKELYDSHWSSEPKIWKLRIECGAGCCSCSFFAPFNCDWGLCCHEKSRHYLETISEHFLCWSYVGEDGEWHSFRENYATPSRSL